MKPLSEKVDITLNGKDWCYKQKDVAKAVKILKDDLHLNISTSPLIDTLIDEIFGSFE